MALVGLGIKQGETATVTIEYGDEGANTADQPAEKRPVRFFPARPLFGRLAAIIALCAMMAVKFERSLYPVYVLT